MRLAKCRPWMPSTSSCTSVQVPKARLSQAFGKRPTLNLQGRGVGFATTHTQPHASEHAIRHGIEPAWRGGGGAINSMGGWWDRGGVPPTNDQVLIWKQTYFIPPSPRMVVAKPGGYPPYFDHARAGGQGPVVRFEAVRVLQGGIPTPTSGLAQGSKGRHGMAHPPSTLHAS